MTAADPRRHEIRYCHETIVSFAQNNEDALIFRALGGKRNGRFIDIGAGHPFADNVTMWLRMMGWTGVNIEPNPIMFHELVKWRPSDTNLNLGIAEKAGQLPYYHVLQDELGHGWGLSSFDPSTQKLAKELGFAVEKKNVEVSTLNRIIDQLRIEDVDVFKVDAEGSEKTIVESIDWRSFRPRLVCIEAVVPNSARPTWPEWEHCLTDAGYTFAYFDGCNAYYALSNEFDILGQLTAGINCNDRIRRATEQDFPKE